MFNYQARLKHVLRPETYWTPEHHAVEMEKLFAPAWHFVGTRKDLARDGDFLTLDLLGQPLLVRNCGGEYHAFLNVCAHRHCQLTTESRGHSERIKCPYHGWEYDKHGRTGRIPDAQAFAPFERERARLVKFRINTCGDLIFVSLTEEGPSLEEFLGTAYDSLNANFSHPWQEVWSWDDEYLANWKIPVENSLESYHMDCLHPKSFGPAPKEELCTHVFEENLTTFHLDISEYRDNPMQHRVIGALGGNCTDRYNHTHVFPHLLVTWSDTFHTIQSVTPVSPTRSSTSFRLFSFRGDRKNPFARVLAKTTAWHGIRWAKKILTEDADIFPAVQRGNEKTVYTGVLGTREERLYVFQDWLAKKCSLGDSDARSLDDAGQLPVPEQPAARPAGVRNSLRPLINSP